MKKQANYLTRFTVIALSFVFMTTAAFADGGSAEVFLKGETSTAAGDFVVTGSDEVYHYMGEEYQVYHVYYDNPGHNMKIAVLETDDCKSYIAYTDDYWFKYDCTKHGFGIRKALFQSEAIRDSFDEKEFHDQSILVKNRKIGREQAVRLIAAYMPKLQA